MADPKLINQVRHFLKENGIEKPTKKELKEWKGCLDNDYIEDEDDSGEKIYALRIRPQSPETQEKYGDAMVQLREWTDKKGRRHCGITTFYHNAQTLFEINYEEIERLKDFRIEKELGDPAAPLKISYYPVFSKDDEMMEKYEKAGLLSYRPGSDFFGGRTEAVFLLPDEAFRSATHEAFCKYIGKTGASILRGGMESTLYHYHEWMMEKLGKKEYEAFIGHAGMLYDNTVKAVAVIVDSCGVAMINRRLTSPEETAFVESLFDRRGLDVMPGTRQKFLVPISNVIKRNLLDDEMGAYYASRLANFLNNYEPMEHARKKNNIGLFKPHVLRAIVFTAKEAQESRLRIAEEALLEDDDENGAAQEEE
ncbi:MAG: hypothetical protein QXU82_02385 [Candidatus Aenigmatarchaeota archaeon]